MNEEEKSTTQIDQPVLKVNVTKLFTKEAYAKHIGVSAVWVCKKIKRKEIKTIPIHGGELVYTG